jgi:hypothetical protein
MKSEFIFLLNVVLLSRLVYVFREQRLTGWGVAALIGVQVFGLLFFTISGSWALLAALLIITALAGDLFEKHSRSIGLVRLVTLFVQLVLASVFTAAAVGLAYNHSLLEWVGTLDRLTMIVALARVVAVPGSDVVLLGGLLVVNEVNLLLRLQLSGLRLSPGKQETDAHEERVEYQHGKVIGILERVLIYIAVMTNQVAAVGLVLAAKGFVRFKEMDDRRFAEYVLIGTLLSAFLALAVALGVKALL